MFTMSNERKKRHEKILKGIFLVKFLKLLFLEPIQIGSRYEI